MFANLQAILESCREALSLNGLAFYQNIELLDEGSGASLLKTIVSHESGQWISTTARIVSCATFRETFNAIESYRRLHALLILGIAPTKGDPLISDDDGNEQFDKVILDNLKKPKKPTKLSEFVDVITEIQYNDLMYELEGFDSITDDIRKFYNISTLADLPATEYQTVLGRIRKLKKTHEDYLQRQQR